MWVCPAAPVLESALPAVPGCVCGCPPHPFPLLGPVPVLRGRLPAGWLPLCASPSSGGLSPLPVTVQAPFPCWTRRVQHRRAQTVLRRVGAHTTQVQVFLPCPVKPPGNSANLEPTEHGLLPNPPHMHTRAHTRAHALPHPTSRVFAIRSVATRQPCFTGEGRGFSFPTPVPGTQEARTAPPRPRSTGQLCKDHSDRRLEWGLGGQASGAP